MSLIRVLLAILFPPLSVFDKGDKTTVMVKRGNKEVRSVIEF